MTTAAEAPDRQGGSPQLADAGQYDDGSEGDGQDQRGEQRGVMRLPHGVVRSAIPDIVNHRPEQHALHGADRDPRQPYRAKVRIGLRHRCLPLARRRGCHAPVAPARGVTALFLSRFDAGPGL